MEIKSVAVLGAGAVGSYVIWGLSEKSDIRLGVIAEGERAERLKKNGCAINGKTYHPEVWTPDEAHDVDLMVVALKYGSLEGALESIQKATGEHTAIMSLMNGIDSEEIIGRTVGMEHVLPALIKVASHKEEDGYHFDPPTTLGIIFGEPSAPFDSERVKAVEELFADTGIHFRSTEYIQEEIWCKFCLNVCSNLPQAILGAGVGCYRDSVHMKAISDGLKRELEAVFWMWISALLGMCTKFSEVTLAVHFREKNAEGDLVGGPMYYIKNGLNKNWHWLAYLFAAFGVLTVFGTGNATQVNTITTAIDSALFNYGVIGVDAAKTVNLVIGIVLAVLIALILLGGIKRIGQVTEKLVPFMAVIYVLLAAGVVLLNLKNIPHVFVSIFEGAFTPTSVTGGAVGSFFISMKKGVSRGIFSNEAGLGTGSIAHACADTKKPVKQGFFGIFEVFIDTIVICTLTALVILCSGVPIGYGEAAGAELTILGFTSTYGSWVSIFTAVAMCCFAFSTIIGWGLYGTRCIEFLFGTKINKPFMVLYSLVAIVGATMDLGLMWNIAETFNGLMAIPNLIAVFLLSGVVVKHVKEYFAGEGKGV